MAPKILFETLTRYYISSLHKSQDLFHSLSYYLPEYRLIHIQFFSLSMIFNSFARVM